MKIEMEKEKGLRLDLVMMPMIDVVFLLLIFFMVTSQFKTLDWKLAAHLPDMGEVPEDIPEDDLEDITPTYIHMKVKVLGLNAENKPRAKTVCITVGDKIIGQYRQPYFGVPKAAEPDGSLQISRKHIFDILGEELRMMIDEGIVGEGLRTPLIILPDPRVPCDDVIQALNTVKGTGLTDVSFGGHVADLDKIYREDGLLRE